MEAITTTDMAKAMDMVMVDMAKATDMAMADMDTGRAVMDMADMVHLAMEDTDITRADMAIMMDTAMDRAHMAMKTMETKVKMTLLAMITKKLAKTMTDTA